MSRKESQLKIGAVLAYIQIFINILLGIFYTPIVIKTLGKSEYGLYNIIVSVISFLSLISFGFDSGYIKYYAKYKKNNDQESIYKLNGLFMIIFSIIALVAFLCGLFLTFNLELVFDEGLTSSEYEIARVLMILLTINLSATFIFNIFTTIILANEKFLFLKLSAMIKTIILPLMSMPLLLIGYKSIAIVIVTLAITIIFDFAYYFYIIKCLKNQFIFNNFENGLFKEIFNYIFYIGIYLIANQINWNLGKILLGRYMNTDAVAIYSVGYTIYGYFLIFSTAISDLFYARIHKVVNATNDNKELQKQELTNLFTKVGRIQFIILMLIATGFIIFGQPFILFWAGEGYDEAYFVALLLIISASIELIQNIGIEIQRALNLQIFRSFAYLITAFANVVISVFLIKAYGIIGAAIGTSLSFIITFGIIINIYYHKKCNLDIVYFWKQILRLSLGLVIPVIAGVLIYSFINLYEIKYFVLFIIIYVVIYCLSMWFIGMNKYEKELISKFLTKIFNGLKSIGKSKEKAE